MIKKYGTLNKIIRSLSRKSKKPKKSFVKNLRAEGDMVSENIPDELKKGPEEVELKLVEEKEEIPENCELFVQLCGPSFTFIV